MLFAGCWLQRFVSCELCVAWCGLLVACCLLLFDVGGCCVRVCPMLFVVRNVLFVVCRLRCADR